LDVVKNFDRVRVRCESLLAERVAGLKKDLENMTRELQSVKSELESELTQHSDAGKDVFTNTR